MPAGVACFFSKGSVLRGRRRGTPGDWLTHCSISCRHTARAETLSHRDFPHTHTFSFFAFSLPSFSSLAYRTYTHAERLPTNHLLRTPTNGSKGTRWHQMAQRTPATQTASASYLSLYFYPMHVLFRAHPHAIAQLFPPPPHMRNRLARSSISPRPITHPNTRTPYCGDIGALYQYRLTLFSVVHRLCFTICYTYCIALLVISNSTRWAVLCFPFKVLRRPQHANDHSAAILWTVFAEWPLCPGPTVWVVS